MMLTSKFAADTARSQKQKLVLEQTKIANKQANAAEDAKALVDNFTKLAQEEYKRNVQSGSKDVIDVEASVKAFKSGIVSAGVTATESADSASYLDLIAESAALEAKNDAIATEIELLDADIKAFDSLHQKEVQQTTQLWCFN